MEKLCVRFCQVGLHGIRIEDEEVEGENALIFSSRDITFNVVLDHADVVSFL